MSEDGDKLDEAGDSDCSNAEADLDTSKTWYKTPLPTEVVCLWIAIAFFAGLALGATAGAMYYSNSDMNTPIRTALGICGLLIVALGLILAEKRNTKQITAANNRATNQAKDADQRALDQANEADNRLTRQLENLKPYDKIQLKLGVKEYVTSEATSVRAHTEEIITEAADRFNIANSAIKSQLAMGIEASGKARHSAITNIVQVLTRDFKRKEYLDISAFASVENAITELRKVTSSIIVEGSDNKPRYDPSTGKGHPGYDATSAMSTVIWTNVGVIQERLLETECKEILDINWAALRGECISSYDAIGVALADDSYTMGKLERQFYEAVGNNPQRFWELTKGKGSD